MVYGVLTSDMLACLSPTLPLSANSGSHAGSDSIEASTTTARTPQSARTDRQGLSSPQGSDFYFGGRLLARIIRHSPFRSLILGISPHFEVCSPFRSRDLLCDPSFSPAAAAHVTHVLAVHPGGRPCLSLHKLPPGRRIDHRRSRASEAASAFFACRCIYSC